MRVEFRANAYRGEVALAYYFPQGGIESVIMELLEEIEHCQHVLTWWDLPIAEYIEYSDMIKENRQLLLAIKA